MTVGELMGRQVVGGQGIAVPPAPLKLPETRTRVTAPGVPRRYATRFGRYQVPRGGVSQGSLARSPRLSSAANRIASAPSRHWPISAPQLSGPQGAPGRGVAPGNGGRRRRSGAVHWQPAAATPPVSPARRFKRRRKLARPAFNCRQGYHQSGCTLRNGTLGPRSAGTSQPDIVSHGMVGEAVDPVNSAAALYGVIEAL